ncbi:nitrogenase cofactor biosynthesis protein NifB [Sulfurovum sp. zt1-1]|uniref:FeMo cofactor biosynthesis protein NifB n=1 Tax=Sulfurovum zhangzhouensis TaxID=3019067 RepID=A0ABT7QWG7_9BACT|nr:nitrogenase cofactor biosynthesis protein NifB [Sulfurovum zhangzhouensis]MDM5270879.1 nitrogenase cofactor biosynthesis protein NifB [Sulfurovum zhangzhouensis]
MSCSSSNPAEKFMPEDIQEKIHNHPCYSEGAHHHYARIHVAVAPACNIQCNYCNRKYDCSNESRPGVTSERLSPEESAKKVMFVGGEVQRLSVLGIAGPGDALANPEKTFKTFELVREKAPDLKLCLSTNGLELPKFVDEMVKYDIDHVTVTINSVDTTGEIGSQIYPWIFYNNKRYYGKEAAQILLERQLEGMKKCVENGILIKANSVLIPGINDKHLPEVAKKLKEIGVFLHNIMPIISEPEYGTKFALDGIPSATDQEQMEVQEACGMDMKLMQHCRQCRADAVGLIGEDRGQEFTKDTFANMTFDDLEIKYDLEGRKETQAKIEEFRFFLDKANERVRKEKEDLSSDGQTILVAVTTAGEGMINQHFGSVKEFLIYEAGDRGIRFIHHRKVDYEYCAGPDGANPIDGIVEKLKDCKLILTAKIGGCPQDDLAKAGLIADQSYAFEPIEASVLKATRKYFNLPEELEAN